MPHTTVQRPVNTWSCIWSAGIVERNYKRMYEMIYAAVNLILGPIISVLVAKTS